MFLRYKPQGAATATDYEFRPAKTDYNRARTAEKLYSKACGERRTWEQFVADATMGSIAARKVALWIAITDRHPMTRFDDIPDFAAGELVMEYSKQELRQMRDGIEAADLLESEKKLQLDGLDAAIREAPAGSDEPDPEPDPEVADSELAPGKDSPQGGDSASDGLSTS